MRSLLSATFTSLLLSSPFAFSGAKDFEPNTKHCSIEEYFQNLVHREAKTSKLEAINTFSVSTIKETRPDGEYWVLWHEKKRLFLIYWPVSSKELCKAGQPGRRNLDLTQDVVKTLDEIKGSTYLVDESWASRILFDAVVRGPQYRISK